MSVLCHASPCAEVALMSEISQVLVPNSRGTLSIMWGPGPPSKLLRLEAIAIELLEVRSPPSSQ